MSYTGPDPEDARSKKRHQGVLQQNRPITAMCNLAGSSYDFAKKMAESPRAVKLATRSTEKIMFKKPRCWGRALAKLLDPLNPYNERRLPGKITTLKPYAKEASTLNQLRRKGLAIATKTIAVSASLVLIGCASIPVDQVELMPAPDIYGDGLINPLPEYDPIEKVPYRGILFATDRQPAGPEDEEKFYLNDRGGILRVGVAKVEFGENEYTWEEVRKFSMRKSRTEKYPIKIVDAEEWGIIGSSVPFWLDLSLETGGNPPPDATQRYADAINAQLAQSGKKDVYIFVHGFKVVYEYPVLVSAELWHFLGYKGAFIAYAWPSTPSSFAYIKDSDTSAGFARNFRLLLETIAKYTNAENIHVIGYSNGTRLVTRALEQLALKYYQDSADEIFERLRIRNVILVGSDLDRGVFDAYLADGLLKTTKHLTIYMSENDTALGASQFLTRRERVGQMFGETGGKMTESGKKAMVKLRNQFSLINVSDAEGADTGNGHGYFRSSPWASSDVLMTLYYGLLPNQRGLVQEDDLPVYSFPPDYLSRLWDAIGDVDPEFAQKYEALKAKQTISAE